MEGDVLELFGRMVVPPNSIVVMTPSILGGLIAAPGMKEDVYRTTKGQAQVLKLSLLV